MCPVRKRKVISVYHALIRASEVLFWNMCWVERFWKEEPNLEAIPFGVELKNLGRW